MKFPLQIEGSKWTGTSFTTRWKSKKPHSFLSFEDFGANRLSGTDEHLENGTWCRLTIHADFPELLEVDTLGRLFTFRSLRLVPRKLRDDYKPDKMDVSIPMTVL